MNPSVSVSLYYMRITERRQRRPLVVDAFDGSTDLLDVVHRALKEFQGNSVEIKGGSRRTYITNDLKRTKRVIDGVVEVGNSGYTASIKDVATNKENYRQRTDEAAMIPLYFRFWIPKGQPYGLAAFQHFADAGCKSAMYTIISDYFTPRFTDHTFALRQVVPKQHVEEVVKNGGIKELRFVQHGVGSDIANMYGGRSLAPGVANMELRVVSRNNNRLAWTSWITQAIKGHANLRAGPLELDSFKCDDFRMKVSVKGKDKLLRIGEFLKLNSRIDVTGEIAIGPNGHPKRRSIEEICEALMAQITMEDTGIAV